MAAKRSGINFTPALAVVVIVLAIGAAFYLGKGQQITPPSEAPSEETPSVGPGTPQPTKKPTPTPTIVPLKQGAETYKVSQGEQAKGPRMSQIEIDNHEPKQGQKQTITVSLAQRNSPVKSASVTIKTDTKERVVPLTMASGTDTDGKWQGSWTADDTLLQRYIMVIEAKDAQDTLSFTLTLRNQ